MEKYYYYCYAWEKGFGSGAIKCEGEFDFDSSIKHVSEKLNHKPIIILNWKEISSEQFKKLSKYYADC